MKKICIFLMAAAFVISCTHKESSDYKVYVDTEFTTMYMRDSDGVTGADGTISFVLDDGTSLFMTGDCFIDKVVDGKRNPNSIMINNTFIHIDENEHYIASYYNGTKEKPEALCVPLEADTAQVHYWYWPGHGFQEGDKLYLYMTKFYQGEPGQWGFRFAGTDFITMNASDYQVISTVEVYDGDCPIHWGHSIMKSGEYYYIYGTSTPQGWGSAVMYVSRARFDGEKKTLVDYEYFDGKDWSADQTKASPCEGTTVPVSEQFSVFQYDDKFVLLTQRRGQQAGDIYSFIADSPEGPWYNEKFLYETDEQIQDKNLFTYNAMAHPQYINEKNELLICYNINSYDLGQIHRDVSTYRPVFLRVPMEMILNK